VHTGGASDGNNLSAAGLPNLDGLGPIGDKLHSAEEFVHLPSLAERARLTARFLEKIAAGEVALQP
jgi:glutamate carboxypeptidase